MKLSEYIEKLSALLETEGDLDLIYSSDDEGNSFQYLRCNPGVVYYSEADYYIISEEDLKEWDFDDYKKVICVN